MLWRGGLGRGATRAACIRLQRGEPSRRRSKAQLEQHSANFCALQQSARSALARSSLHQPRDGVASQCAHTRHASLARATRLWRARALGLRQRSGGEARADARVRKGSGRQSRHIQRARALGELLGTHVGPRRRRICYASQRAGCAAVEQTAREPDGVAQQVGVAGEVRQRKGSCRVCAQSDEELAREEEATTAAAAAATATRTSRQLAGGKVRHGHQQRQTRRVRERLEGAR